MEEKLRRLMKHEGINSTRLAEILGIQASGISHIMSGRNKPSYDFLLKLLQRFPQISPDWLMLDRGPMYRDEIKRGSSPSTAAGVGAVSASGALSGTSSNPGAGAGTSTAGGGTGMALGVSAGSGPGRGLFAAEDGRTDLAGDWRGATDGSKGGAIGVAADPAGAASMAGAARGVGFSGGVPQPSTGAWQGGAGVAGGGAQGASSGGNRDVIGGPRSGKGFGGDTAAGASGGGNRDAVDGQGYRDASGGRTGNEAGFMNDAARVSAFASRGYTSNHASTGTPDNPTNNTPGNISGNPGTYTHGCPGDPNGHNDPHNPGDYDFIPANQSANQSADRSADRSVKNFAKSVERVVVFYRDKTFSEYRPE